MKVVDYPQGSAEWLASRVGLVTASRVADILARTKSGWGASRAAYLGELVAERLTGVSAAPTYMNDDMRRGRELEPFARIEYEVFTGSIVTQCGLVLHDTLTAGASPDGLVGEDGLIEIKCPRTHVHIEYIDGGEPPAKYRPQMDWQCICTGRAWVDFVSYDPNMPERLRLFVARYTPDLDRLRELEAEVSRFIAEVDAKVSSLKEKAA
jgi:hypothetical protein